MRFLVVLGLFVFVVQSCEPIKREETTESYSLVRTDSFRLSLGERHALLSNISYIQNDSIEFIGLLTKAVDSFPTITFFDLRKESNELNIPLDNVFGNGNPNKHTSIKGFYVVSIDSVFVLNRDVSVLYLINQSGTIINHWQFNKTDFALFSTEDFPFIVKRGLLIVGQELKEPAYMIDSIIRIKYYKSAIMANYRLSDSTAIQESEFGHYPAIYQSYYYYDHGPSVCYSEDKIYISFSMSNAILVYNYSGQLIDSFGIDSDFHRIESISPFPSDSVTNYHFIRKYFANKSYLGKSFYDRYNNLIYRVLIHAHDFIDASTGLIRDESEKPWSLQVIDAKTNELLFEKEFRPREYSYRNIFCTGTGLYIAKYWENKPGLFQDEVVFDVFTLK